MGACKDCGSSDGTFYASWPEVCAACRQKRQRAYYAANQAKYTGQVRTYQHANPSIVRASSAVRWAVKTGKLTPTHCESCGAEKTEAHHSSYSPDMWLVVTWLCRSCHRKAHRAAA